MRLCAFERRWLATICRAILPQRGETYLPGAEDLPIESFIDDFFAHTPGGSSIGVRLATWIIVIAALLRFGRGFGRLAREKQSQLLQGMVDSKFYVVRELPTLVKLVAFLAYDGEPELHRALGIRLYDGSKPAWMLEASK